MGKASIRVGVISIHAAPYRDPVLGRLINSVGLEIEVITLRGNAPFHQQWVLDDLPYRHKQLEPRRFFGNRLFHPNIVSLLNRGNYDAVLIPGFGQNWTNFYVFLYCIWNRIPFIYSGDTVTCHKYSLGERVILQFKHLRDGIVGRLAGAVFVPGASSREYWDQRGVPADQIFEGCYTLSAVIIDYVQRARKEKATQRAKYGLATDAIVFLMVANFLPTRKHIDLIHAFSRLRRDFSIVFLVLVGKGPTLVEVKDLVAEKGMDNVVFIEGVPFEALADIYALSDIYVHSGSEPYSTALQYGALAGLPLISSKHVGACKDYIIEGESGVVVECSSQGYYDGMSKILLMDYQAMGKRAKMLAIKRTESWATDQLLRAIWLSISKCYPN